MSFWHSYAPFLSAPLRPAVPQYLILFVTDRCNANCAMCFNRCPDRARQAQELSLTEMEQLARGCPDLIQLTISGGEPFLRDDLPEIIRAFVRQSRVRFVTLSTNAFLPDRVIPATERILRENPETRFNFCVSIDDIGARHEAIRGVSGGFERLLETCRGATRWRRQFGHVELHTTTVLSAANAERIPEILAWIGENLDAEVPEVLLVRGNPRDPRTLGVDLAQYATAAAQVRALSADRAKGDLKNKLITTLTGLMSDVLVRSEREQRMVVPCVAGGKLAVVRADGTVDPCEILATLVPPERRPDGLETFALGRLQDSGYDLMAVARSAKAARVRRFIHDRRCHCTFECAIFASLVFGPRTWPRLGCRFLREWCG